MPGTEPTATAPRATLLEVAGLSVRYGGVQAVHGVSLSVGTGEAVGIIGANGAGKTSVLKAILGLAPRTAQRIRFGQHDLLRTPARNIVRCGIGYVPEGRRLFAPLSVEKNLLLGAYTRRWDSETRDGLSDVYEIFPALAEMRGRQAGALSGGQQQMLAIGRALMSRPNFILMDEPSLGLAPLVVESVHQAIDRIRREMGIGGILVEQNVAVALTVAARAYVLMRGSVVLEGDPKTLAASPQLKDAYLGLASGVNNA